MERKIVLAPGEYYHIYNRGVEKRRLFFDDVDRDRFVRLIFLANSDKPFVFRLVQGRPLDEIDVGEKRVAIGAYVLMPNHFHILIKEIKEGGASNFMEKLQTGYSMYFNKKNERVGPLFQGRFKAQHVVRDEHLKYLFAYIHLNPMKLIEPDWKDRGIRSLKRAHRYIENYRHSSYLDYAGMVREERRILSPEEFPEYFSDPLEFGKFISDWLSFRHR
jgi:REP-associated tyrosine transposase